MSHHNREDICVLDDEFLDPEQLGLSGSLIDCTQCSCLVCVETTTKVRPVGQRERYSGTTVSTPLKRGHLSNKDILSFPRRNSFSRAINLYTPLIFIGVRINHGIRMLTHVLLLGC